MSAYCDPTAHSIPFSKSCPLGRADDIINVGGEKVSPVEVESIAQEYDGIRECAFQKPIINRLVCKAPHTSPRKQITDHRVHQTP